MSPKTRSACIIFFSSSITKKFSPMTENANNKNSGCGGPRKTGEVVLFDPTTCWGLIKPLDGSRLVYGMIDLEIHEHVHLHPSLSLNIRKEYDAHTYMFDTHYDTALESNGTYKRIVCWDSINNIAVVSNDKGRLMVTHYTNAHNVVPQSLHLPPGCEIVCNFFD